MNLDALIDEARLLARTGAALAPGDGTHAAWSYPYDAGAPVLALAQRAEVLVVTPDGRGGGAVSRQAAPPAGGRPLVATPWVSLPPLDAIFALGSDDVGRWLAARDWPRDCPYNDNFGDPAAEAYERWWQDQHPFYLGTAAALLGGWHFGWPEEEWLARAERELVAWTLQSEPWVEVWRDEGGLEVVERLS